MRARIITVVIAVASAAAPLASVAFADTFPIDGAALAKTAAEASRGDPVLALTRELREALDPARKARAQTSFAGFLTGELFRPVRKNIEVTRAPGEPETNVVRVELDYRGDRVLQDAVEKRLGQSASARGDLQRVCIDDAVGATLFGFRRPPAEIVSILEELRIRPPSEESAITLHLRYGPLKIPVSVAQIARELGLNDDDRKALEELLAEARAVAVTLEPAPVPKYVELSADAVEGATTLRVKATLGASGSNNAVFDLQPDTKLVLEVNGRGPLRLPVTAEVVQRSAWLSLAALKALEGSGVRLNGPLVTKEAVGEKKELTRLETHEVTRDYPTVDAAPHDPMTWTAVLFGADAELLGVTTFTTRPHLRARMLPPSAQTAGRAAPCDIEVGVTVEGPRWLEFPELSLGDVERIKGIEIFDASRFEVQRTYANPETCSSGAPAMLRPRSILVLGEGAPRAAVGAGRPRAFVPKGRPQAPKD